MDHIFHQSTSNHGEHDVGWLIISSSCEYPVCIACLVEQLADQTLTKVHHQYILSLLSSVLECEDVLYILRRHYSVCEQILQIIIGMFSQLQACQYNVVMHFSINLCYLFI